MRRVLTTGLLLLFLLVPAGSSGAQTPGPGPGEVPSELWREYPLEEPPADSREGGGQQQSPNPQQARTREGEADGGGQGASFLVIAGALLLLMLLAILAVAARRSGPERFRQRGAPPGRTSVGPQAVSVSPARVEHPAVGAPPRAPDWTAPERGGEAPARARFIRQTALGYASAPAAGDSKDVLNRQQREIAAACERKGLALLKLVHDSHASAGSDLSRPGLAYALERLAADDASCLVVSSVERLTRSPANLGTLVEWLDRCGARLVVVDIDLDTGTPEGRLSARELATVGGPDTTAFEERTAVGLEEVRTAPEPAGQPAVSDGRALKRRIADMRASGMTLQAIADTLNAEGVPTLRGGIRWRPSSVQAAAGYKRPNRKSGFA